MNEVEEARQLRQILGDLDATSEFPELNELPRAELLFHGFASADSTAQILWTRPRTACNRGSLKLLNESNIKLLKRIPFFGSVLMKARKKI